MNKLRSRFQHKLFQKGRKILRKMSRKKIYNGSFFCNSNKKYLNEKENICSGKVSVLFKISRKNRFFSPQMFFVGTMQKKSLSRIQKQSITSSLNGEKSLIFNSIYNPFQRINMFLVFKLLMFFLSENHRRISFVKLEKYQENHQGKKTAVDSSVI